jgi:hypothetical protein
MTALGPHPLGIMLYESRRGIWIDDGLSDAQLLEAGYAPVWKVIYIP